MVHNPHVPQEPQGTQGDPAGSTQMFRAFVDEGEGGRGPSSDRGAGSGARIGLVIGAVAVIAVFAGVAWLAFA
ncbi:hypothetical protein [Streptomyces oceani]|uniref:Uncharacterized protein n=1 Tax=Streptomyces oceani TaxID=1075402 RepID=A0A1E7JWF4_9ACTN|nr:hypothetical protein [Streptomyces oceani]OEU95991.1 hypothetical protein AN216_22985 [Streptomyces oceani]